MSSEPKYYQVDWMAAHQSWRLEGSYTLYEGYDKTKICRAIMDEVEEVAPTPGPYRLIAEFSEPQMGKKIDRVDAMCELARSKAAEGQQA